MIARPHLRAVALALLALFLGAAIPAAAQSRRTPIVAPQGGLQPIQRLSVPIGKSQVLRVTQTVSRVAVGNPEIADVQPLSDRQFYIIGKSAGATNVQVYGDDSRLLAVVDVIVGADVEGLKAALHDVIPSEHIGVRSVNDAVALTGVVSSAARASQAVEVAKKFTEKVVNQLSIKGTQQVMLQVKVAEMQRTLAKQLGITHAISGGQEGGFSFATLDPFSSAAYAVAGGLFKSGNLNPLQFSIEAAEQKGVVKTLAEPNLVAMSGDTANFLAGGEFPVPIAQTTNGSVPVITVEFKQFGVALAFTPTVLDGDLINLVIAPEVSQIDRTNSVTYGNFSIPGIATRRARTTVELRDGQSFAIAGLISSDFNDTVRGIPGFMDVPVLGTLFRSSSYQRNETELVIIVTPKLVQPAPANTLAAPTDSFVPPSDGEIFFIGNSENADSGLAPQTGGLTGRYGHIIR